MLTNNIPRERPPTHPGEMLREEFLPEYELSETAFAHGLGISTAMVNALLQEQDPISPLMALRLSRFFGNSAQFWLNAQQAHDLWQAQQTHATELAQIRRFNDSALRRVG